MFFLGFPGIFCGFLEGKVIMSFFFVNGDSRITSIMYIFCCNENYFHLFMLSIDCSQRDVSACDLFYEYLPKKHSFR